jgi:hypothetical protein
MMIRHSFFIFTLKMVPKHEIIAAEYQHAYINHIKEGDVHKALKKNTREFKKFLKTIPHRKIDHAYADGKWTLRDMLQHIIDAERVFAYRALSFARKDNTPLPGFDENSWAANAGGTHRKWSDLIEEFKALRQSTELLFGSFTDEQLRATGTADGQACNVLALGFLPAGHAAHHMRIIKEKYL